MSPLDPVLSRLDRVRQQGVSQWSARCPAHDDRSPSLSLSLGEDGRVLVHCHAGCSVEAICAALELSVRDLFSGAPPQAGAARAHSVTAPPPAASFASSDAAVRAATAIVRRERGPTWSLAQYYSYARADGGEHMRILRFEPPKGGAKTFRPIHPARPGWRIGDPPGRLPLYRLPDLTGAVVVHVVEGEKAAEAAAAIGLVATTNAHGAKAAKRTDWLPLAGRTAILMPDNDEPGRGWVQDVASALIDLASIVRVVELPDLPDHGDIVEFVAARRAGGATDAAIREEIEALGQAAPTFVGSVGALPGLSTESSDSPEAASEASGGFGGAPPGPIPGFGEPDPLPNELPPVDKFDPWLLPRVLRGWVTDMSERIQCPPDYPAVAAMVAIGAVLGRKVGIRPKRCDDWIVVANLWGALIGRPGVMKTPPLQEATRPLRRLEASAQKVAEEQNRNYAAQKLVYDARKKHVEAEIKRRLKEPTADSEEITREALELVGREPIRPVRRRYIVNDSTVEKLGELLKENTNGLLCFRDELVGLLKSLDREGQEGARSFYLESWNGTGRFTYDRIGRGTVDIEAAIVSVLGSIQPGPLAGYLRSAVDGGLDDDGLVSRFQLLVWPDVSANWINVDRWPDTNAKNEAFAAFERLDKLQLEDVGAERDHLDGGEGIPFLRFDPRAQFVFDRWRGGLERRLRAEEEHAALESHFSKYRSLIPSLALLIHLADGRQGQVGVECLRKALSWGRYLSSHARRVYAVSCADDVGAAKRLVARIRKGDVQDGFTERDVYRADWSGLDRDAVHKAVSVLVDHGWLAAERTQTGGRPKTVFRVNPRVLRGSLSSTSNANAAAERILDMGQKGTDKAATRTSGGHGTPEEDADGNDNTDPRTPVAPDPPRKGTATTDTTWGRM